MTRRHRILRNWFLGVCMLAASLAGTGWVLYTRAGDSPVKAGEATGTATRSQGTSVVCFGHVDADPGVTALYPVQPGRVGEVLVHEDDSVKAGTVLFRIDDRRAKLQVRQAQEDLKGSELQLADARKQPQQHALKISQQEQAILATQHRLSAAQRLLEHNRTLVKKELAAADMVEVGA